MTKRAFLHQVLRLDFTSFLQQAFTTLHPGHAYLPNWHIDAIAHRLGLVAQGSVRRLIINQPPRSMKSIAVSVAYVAWRLGHDPGMRIIVVSYNADFARSLHLQFRTIIESEWYQSVFPGTRWKKKTDSDCVTSNGGGRFATSIGGQLTGRGGDLLILDDPMNAADIHSEPSRKTVIEFFSTTLLSRLNNKSTDAIILVMQRLHEDDLAGHLLAQDGWDHLNLSAVAIEDADIPIGLGRVHHRRTGDILHPAREDRATLDALKAEMGSLVFSAQYQQSPIPIEGNLVKRVDIERSMYEGEPHPEGLKEIVQSWDIATATGANNDYAVCTTWLTSRSDVYLLDVWLGRASFPNLRRKVIALAQHHKADTVLIEDAGPGLQLLQDLRAATPAGMTRPIGCKPEGSKADRMAIQSSRIEAGMVHLPKSATWLDDYLAELLGFPATRHDDQVDSTSQFLNWWWTRGRQTEFFPGSVFVATAPRFDPFGHPDNLYPNG